MEGVQGHLSRGFTNRLGRRATNSLTGFNKPAIVLERKYFLELLVKFKFVDILVGSLGDRPDIISRKIFLHYGDILADISVSLLFLEVIDLSSLDH